MLRDGQEGGALSGGPGGQQEGGEGARVHLVLPLVLPYTWLGGGQRGGERPKGVQEHCGGSGHREGETMSQL